MAGSEDDIPPPPPPPSQNLTTTKPLDTVLPPKTAEEILARERERKVQMATLLMALQKDHLAKFHKMTDAKEIGATKGYDRFQSLLSQLEIHGAGVSTEDANQKFLRSLPSAWSQVSLIMRTKPGVDSLSFDDLYNNLRVFESDVKGSTHHPLARRMWQFCPQLDHEDLEQLDEFDLEEMDLKWQVAMISMRMKKFYKKTGHFAREWRSKGIQNSRKRDAWNTRNKDKENRRRFGKQEDSKALVTLDGEGVDWTSHSEDEQENYALMAYSSSGSDTEREQLGDASIEIQAYTQALKKVEAQLVVLINKMSARDKAGLGQAVPTNAARKVNTVKPIVNNARPKAGFHKTLSPFRKPFNRTTTLRTNFSYQKVNTAEENTVSVVGGKRETAVKPSVGCNWRHKGHYWNKVSKYNGGSSSRILCSFQYPLGRTSIPKRLVP
ncbi:hypothetical protein Tco_1402426 [Tanacetum coccineum]